MNNSTCETGRNDHVHGDENYTELGMYECDCGEVWDDKIGRRSLDECYACDKRVCKSCVGRCLMCGQPYCPQHTPECLDEYQLCEDCLGDWPDFPSGPARATLIEIACRLDSRNGNYYRVYGMASDMRRLMGIALKLLGTLSIAAPTCTKKRRDDAD